MWKWAAVFGLAAGVLCAQPTKEYIYLGGRLIAVDTPGSTIAVSPATLSVAAAGGRASPTTLVVGRAWDRAYVVSARTSGTARLASSAGSHGTGGFGLPSRPRRRRPPVSPHRHEQTGWLPPSRLRVMAPAVVASPAAQAQVLEAPADAVRAHRRRPNISSSAPLVAVRAALAKLPRWSDSPPRRSRPRTSFGCWRSAWARRIRTSMAAIRVRRRI